MHGARQTEALKTIGLDIALDWNPRHTIRFASMGLSGRRWLYRLQFTADRSLVLCPIVGTPVGFFVDEVSPTGNQKKHIANLDGSGDFHITFHRSGIVNLTAPGTKYRIQGKPRKILGPRHVVTLQLNSTDFLKPATENEVNSNRGQSHNFPLATIPGIPQMLSVYVARDTIYPEWRPPMPQDAVVTRAVLPAPKWGCVFYLLFWQCLSMRPKPGEALLGIHIGPGVEKDLGMGRLYWPKHLCRKHWIELKSWLIRDGNRND